MHNGKQIITNARACYLSRHMGNVSDSSPSPLTSLWYSCQNIALGIREKRLIVPAAAAAAYAAAAWSGVTEWEKKHGGFIHANSDTKHGVILDLRFFASSSKRSLLVVMRNYYSSIMFFSSRLGKFSDDKQTSLRLSPRCAFHRATGYSWIRCKVNLGAREEIFRAQNLTT